MELSQMSWRS